MASGKLRVPAEWEDEDGITGSTTAGDQRSKSSSSRIYMVSIPSKSGLHLIQIVV